MGISALEIETSAVAPCNKFICKYHCRSNQSTIADEMRSVLSPMMREYQAKLKETIQSEITKLHQSSTLIMDEASNLGRRFAMSGLAPGEDDSMWLDLDETVVNNGTVRRRSARLMALDEGMSGPHLDDTVISGPMYSKVRKVMRENQLGRNQLHLENPDEFKIKTASNDEKRFPMSGLAQGENDSIGLDLDETVVNNGTMRRRSARLMAIDEGISMPQLDDTVISGPMFSKVRKVMRENQLGKNQVHLENPDELKVKTPKTGRLMDITNRNRLVKAS